jgi:hypothetical protein
MDEEITSSPMFEVVENLKTISRQKPHPERE